VHVKGALYVVLGESKRSLVTKRNWEVMTRLWPALVQAQLHCEKPSVLKLFDDVIDKLHNDIETTEISLVVRAFIYRYYYDFLLLLLLCLLVKRDSLGWAAGRASGL